MDMLPPTPVEAIQDRQGHLLGRYERKGVRVILRDRRGHLVGSHDGTVTRDRQSHIIGQGNHLPAMLLHGR